MKPVAVLGLFMIMAAVVGVMVLENGRITRENEVKPDNAAYQYALVVSLTNGGSTSSMVFYSAEQCEYAKKYINQQAYVSKVVCVPVPFDPPSHPTGEHAH